MSAIDAVLLVGSNIALLPAIVYAYSLGLAPELSVLAAVFVVSSVYHLCQTDVVCLLGVHFSVFQHQDHFFVYGALVWIVLYLIGLRLPQRFAVFVWIQALLFPLILEFMSAWWFSGLVVGIVVLSAVLLVAIVTRSIPRYNLFSLVAAVVLTAAGFALHLVGGDPSPPSETGGSANKKYTIFHSLWHVLVMLAIYYVIDLRHGHSLLVRLLRNAFYYTAERGEAQGGTGVGAAKAPLSTTAAAGATTLGPLEPGRREHARRTKNLSLERDRERLRPQSRTQRGSGRKNRGGVVRLDLDGQSQDIGHSAMLFV